MSRKFSFCKMCNCYHVNWDSLNREYETHLSPQEKEEMMAFAFYKKELPKMKDVFMVCAYPDNFEKVLRAFPSGFFGPEIDNSKWLIPSQNPYLKESK